MPVAEDTDSERDRDRLPHRTWRELPASPPLADPLPPPDPSTFGAPLPPPTQQDGGSDVAAATGVSAVDAPRPRRWWLLGVAVAAVLALVLGGAWLLGRDDAGTTPTVSADEGQGSPATVAKALGPAVVQLEVGGGVGAGVVFDTAELVLTAHHVVADTDELSVKSADGTAYPGRVVGRAPERDLAVVALDGADGLTAASFGDGNALEVGQEVVAVGSPFGFQASVTSGIVSGLDRELDTPVGTLSGLIQTDAPINPGNSGGPLADVTARVVGINTAIASSSGGSQGIGFAVPIGEATSLIDQVRTDGGVAAPTVEAPGGGGGLGGLIPGLDDLLPNLPGLDDLFGQGGLGGTLQDLLDQLFGDIFGGDEGSGSQDQQGAAPDQGPTSELALIEVQDLPTGWQQERNQVATKEVSGEVQGTQRVVLGAGSGDGTIVVEAVRGPSAADQYDALSGGAGAKVGGKASKELDNGGVAWMAENDLLVMVRPSEGVPAGAVEAVANSVAVVS